MEADEGRAFILPVIMKLTPHELGQGLLLGCVFVIIWARTLFGPLFGMQLEAAEDDHDE